MTSRTLSGLLAAGMLFACSHPLFSQSFASGTVGVNGAVPTRRSDSLEPLRGARDAEAAQHHLFLRVREGVLTVDGFTGKVHLNYDIENQDFLYFFMPGAGTAVVSLAPMPDAVAVERAFDGSSLSFSAGGHQFVLTSRGPLLRDPKKGKILKAPETAYVRFDGEARFLDRNAKMGFGHATAAPYAWPAALRESVASNERHADAPPLPKDILPVVTAEPATSAGAAQAGSSQ